MVFVFFDNRPGVCTFSVMEVNSVDGVREVWMKEWKLSGKVTYDRKATLTKWQSVSGAVTFNSTCYGFLWRPEQANKRNIVSGWRCDIPVGKKMTVGAHFHHLQERPNHWMEQTSFERHFLISVVENPAASRSHQEILASCMFWCCRCFCFFLWAQERIGAKQRPQRYLFVALIRLNFQCCVASFTFWTLSSL